MLVVHRVEIRRHERAVLRNVSFCSTSPGLIFLVGPGGAGKSTLLAALAGDQGEELSPYSGIAELDGVSLKDLSTDIVRVPQHAQLPPQELVADAIARLCDLSSAALIAGLARAGFGSPRDVLLRRGAELPSGERRTLAVLFGLQRVGRLYLVDEPTAGLAPAQIECVRARLTELAASACVIVATHNRQDCLALGGSTALLAGGAIQEFAPSDRFFSQPASGAARNYVATGNCGLPPTTEPCRREQGIWWVVPGLLAGMSRPGLVDAAETQYQALHARGVDVIACLEERVAYPMAPLIAAGLQHQHLPVADMAPPSFSQAVDLCRLAEPAIRNNRGIALHCRGGLGRTGTGLAAILVWFGDSADDAIAKVRRAQPLAIQSVSQLRFVREFASRVRGWH